tara:strand:+ start:97 stop:387 length:291 start_codon:yes stop_codon:yes gene_type:complete
MTYKADWKTELEKVRSYMKEDKTPVVEKTQDEIISDEIDSILEGFDEPAEESQESDVNTDKLIEKNMLGRLAKSLDLTEEKKSMLFNYFEKGELIQ